MPSYQTLLNSLSRLLATAWVCLHQTRLSPAHESMSVEGPWVPVCGCVTMVPYAFKAVSGMSAPRPLGPRVAVLSGSVVPDAVHHSVCQVVDL